MHIHDTLTEQKAYERWIADNGEDLRLDYPLIDGSVVLDIGGHVGDWAADLLERYPTVQLWIFEPVAAHVEELNRRFVGQANVRVVPAAAGTMDGEAEIVLRGTGSSLFGSGAQESIKVVDLVSFLRKEKINDVALAKINIEGGEFEFLDHLLDRGVIGYFRDLQIQFHDVFPDAKGRRNAIRERLSATHERTYDYPFVWENWTRRS